jgi:hypothetical protein
MIENGGVLEEDRPVRDLSALRFFPHLKTLRLQTAVRDVTPLAAVPGLKSLQLDDEVLADLRGLEALTQLEELRVTLKSPWPSIAAVGALPSLKNVHFRGNLLAWRDVPELRTVESMSLMSGHDTNTPLRNAHELPAMPQVKSLTVERVADLAGLERFATVQKLVLAGPFVDLAPLAALGEARTLKLSGEDFSDLHPVARMPRLHTLELWRHRGLDVAPLAEAPRLRQVEAKITEVIKTELASLNAALGFVDETIFAAEGSAPEKPLRFIAFDATRPGFKPHRRPDPREETYAEDPLLAPAEEKWFTRLLTRRLDDLLTPGWGHINTWRAGNANIALRRPDELLRLREIVFALHEVILRARFPWTLLLDVAPPDADEEDTDEADEVDEDEDEETEFEREREEWREQQERWKEHREYLEREHRLRLQQQEGRPIDPENFAAPAAKAQPVESTTPASNEAADKATSEARADFRLMLHVSPGVVAVHMRNLAPVMYYLEQPFEDWHALPEPPEQRPFLP